MPRGEETNEDLQTSEPSGDDASLDSGLVGEADAADTGSDSSSDDSAIEIKSEKNDTARDTARKALEELKAQQSDGDKGKKKTPKSKQVQGEKKVGAKPDADTDSDDDDDTDPELSPPEGLRSAEREVFLNAPKTLRRAFTRMWKGYQATGTRNTNELTRERARYKGYKEIDEDIAEIAADLGYRSGDQFMKKMAPIHKRLQSPDTSVSEFVAMGKRLGHITSDGKFQGVVVKSSGNVNDISNNPTIAALQSENKQLKQRIDAIDASHQQAQAQPAIQEMQAVADEVDEASGDWKYPELQNVDFINEAKPFVIALVQRTPGLSWGEALRRVWSTLTGKPSVERGPGGQTRLPAANNTNTNSRAHTAASTVRAKLNNKPGGDFQVPDAALADGRATAAWALSELRRAGGR